MMSERQTFRGLQHLNTSNSFMLCHVLTWRMLRVMLVGVKE